MTLREAYLLFGGTLILVALVFNLFCVDCTIMWMTKVTIVSILVSGRVVTVPRLVLPPRYKRQITIFGLEVVYTQLSFGLFFWGDTFLLIWILLQKF